MDENIAGLLCYVGGWITGLIFYLIDKRPFVRFHAAQSIAVFGGLQVLDILVADIFFPAFSVAPLGLFSLGTLLIRLIYLIGLVLWILLMIKAYQHEKYKVPVVAAITDALVGKG